MSDLVGNPAPGPDPHSQQDLQRQNPPGEHVASNANPGEPEPGPAHKAGRDLRAATAVGLGLAVVVLGTLFVWRPAFVGLVIVVMALACWELAQALAKQGVRVPFVPVLIGTVIILIGGYAGGATPMMVGFGLTVAAVAVWRLGDHRHGYARDTAAGIFTTLYIPFLAGFAVLMLRNDEDGALQVLALLVVVVASDTGGYFAGSLLGRHPMAPNVSPKKSWEGLAGSVILGLGAGVALSMWVFDGTWQAGLVLGAVGVVGATVGDLGESLIKRDIGIKDMSNLLPGHGGFMDRLDSLLPTAPLVWLVFAYVL